MQVTEEEVLEGTVWIDVIVAVRLCKYPLKG